MSAQEKSSEEKIAQLREDYVKGMPVRFLDMNQKYIDILESQRDAESIYELEMLSHTLCGSAGTFGFGDIAGYCKRMEGLCQLLISDTNDKEIMDELSKTFSQLEEAILNPRVTSQEVLLDLTIEKTVKLTSKLIYILDDDKELTQDLQLKIERYGYTVRQFQVLETFFDAVEKELPEAMIIDIMLDDDCGTDALKFLYDHLSVHIPSIVISAKHDFESRLKTVRASADAFLTKPFDTTDIIDCLESLIGDKNNESYRVLIVDDIEAMSAYYGIVLERSGIICETSSKPEEIMQTLADFEPELVLMDLHMPECRGDEMAQLIHQEKKYISLPIVYLSSETSAREQLLALQRGGDDFLTKPIRPSELVGAVMSRARRYRLIKSFINKDSLTGLLNHSSLKATLDKECARSSRSHQSFCFAMVDLDYFKNINDKYGHATGDVVLKNLSWLFKQRLRKTDIVGRYGGEEFGIIMPDTSMEAAEQTLNTLLKVFRDLDIKVNQEVINVTFSAGIAEYPLYQTADEICRAADKLLYDAKYAGRNRIVVDHSHHDSGKAQATV